jgi:hypothetical protein
MVRSSSVAISLIGLLGQQNKKKYRENGEARQIKT